MSTPRPRAAGLSALAARSNLSTHYTTHGAALRSTSTSTLSTQLSVFKSLLHSFALQHGDAIRTNPSFRSEFARMCNAIGVDPSAAANAAAQQQQGKSKAGWLDGLLAGGEGKGEEFYVRVATRIVEVCLATRGENGGLLGVGECRDRVGRGEREVLGGGIEVTEEDILKAVESLKPLGSSFSVIMIGNQQMIRSVPKELNEDQAVVLGALQDLGYVTASMLEDNFGWEMARAQTVLDDLLTDSLVWINEKGEDNVKLVEKEYWSPAGLEGDDDY